MTAWSETGGRQRDWGASRSKHGGKAGASAANHRETWKESQDEEARWWGAVVREERLKKHK